MKIYLKSVSSESEGIRAETATVELDKSYYDYADRKLIKKILHRAFDDIFVEGVEKIQFEDECPDCETILNPDKFCPNKDCISNTP